MSLSQPERLTSDDRKKFWDIVSLNIVDDDGGLIPSDMWGDRGLYALKNTDPELYQRLVDKFVWSGFQSFTKDVAKKNQTTTVRRNGEARTLSRYVSVKCVQEDGEIIERQKLVETLTISELGQVRDDVRAQIDRLGYNIEMCERLLALCIHYGANSVQDALDAAGKTIDEYLGEE